MRTALFLCVSVLFAAAAVDAKRFGGGGGSRRGGSGSRPKTPSQPTRSDPFINSERGHSGGSTYNRPSPAFKTPAAPNPHTPLGFDKVNSPSAPQPPKPPTVQSNGPLGFEKVNSGNQQGSHPIGFDRVNSESQNRGGNPHVPSAPPYPGAPNGPPPAYYPGTHTGNSYSGAGDHPPAYPGRPVNAPPSYSAGNPYNGQAHPSQPGYPGQQQGFGGNGFGYPQQNQFGGSYPSGGSPYPSNTGFFPASGNYPHSTSYQGNTYGGSPFGNNGYNGNPNYNPSNFGYSSNPGYFGHQGGYSNNYQGQYDGYQKKSRFGGLPIPIPIPIPIPFGGGGFGSFGGFGGNGGYSHNHRLLDTFIKDQNNTQTGNSSTSVFILNNSTVAPCTTDHFVYEFLKVSVVSCTAEYCTGIKVSTTTNISNVVSVHSAGLTVCLENNATYSYYGEKVTPSVSPLRQENVTVCRDVVKNVTTATNETATTTNPETTTLPTTTVDATTVQETTTYVPTTPSTEASNTTNTTRVCDTVECSHVEMCLPSIEVVDKCSTVDCPFRRTGYKPCVTVKMCRSPSTPVSTFASLNTTISKIDEYNNYNSVFDAANLTLISYHRPVINFNCPQNGTVSGNSSSLCTPRANSTKAQ